MTRTRIALVVGSMAVAALAASWMPLLNAAQRAKAKTSKTAARDPAADEAERGEWSRWRGPKGDGLSLETGLLDRWPEGGPPLAWKAKGLGGGYSSVAVVGEKVFTLGNKDGENQMVCLSAEDGAHLWSTPFGNGDPNSTPTVAGDLVFGVSRDGVLACCKVADGSLVWSKSYGRDFQGQEPTWGFSESVLVDGDRVICTPGGEKALLASLDKQTGETIWTTEATDELKKGRGHGGAGYASVVVGNAGGVKQYVTLVGKGAVGVDAASGKLLWTYNGVANGTAVIPTPIVTGDYVFCSSGYGTGTALLKLNKSKQGFDVDEVYFLPANKMQNHHGGMIQKDGFVYCGHGHNEGFPLCINGSTGKDAWRPGRGPGGGSAAVAYADGHLYFRYQDGTMALIEASPKAFKLKGTFKIAVKNGESWPHPVIAGGKLYLRDQDELVVYDVKK